MSTFCNVIHKSGCAYIDHSKLNVSNDNATPLSRLTDSHRKVHRIFQLRRMALDTLPVGSIIAFYDVSVAPLPENWQLCNGDLIHDVRSPLNGVKTPDLSDNRFLMGTGSSYGQYGGTNELMMGGKHTHSATTSIAGAHNHGGKTGPETSNGNIRPIEGVNEKNVRLAAIAHRHPISTDGDHTHDIAIDPAAPHNHGGDKRPNWFGVAYIMKIKD